MANVHWTVYLNIGLTVFFAGLVPAVGVIFAIVRRIDRMEGKIDAVLQEQSESRVEQHEIKRTVERVKEEVIKIDGRVTALERMRT